MSLPTKSAVMVSFPSLSYFRRRIDSCGSVVGVCGGNRTREARCGGLIGRERGDYVVHCRDRRKERRMDSCTALDDLMAEQRSKRRELRRTAVSYSWFGNGIRLRRGRHGRNVHAARQPRGCEAAALEAASIRDWVSLAPAYGKEPTPPT